MSLLAISNPIRPLETLLKSILTFFHAQGLSWAWSIVALTIVVRIVLVPLVVRQIHSMQNLQAHAP
ncbi:MAG: 60Kd inner membrane protein, partial [Actinomycetota bacterium]|nr:60Kd inner membrane protein [Actinomycetota bacterium]